MAFRRAETGDAEQQRHPNAGTETDGQRNIKLRAEAMFQLKQAA